MILSPFLIDLAVNKPFPAPGSIERLKNRYSSSYAIDINRKSEYFIAIMGRGQSAMPPK
jgi:hypothetical protein